MKKIGYDLFAGAAARGAVGAMCMGADCRSDHGRDKLVLDERDSCVALGGIEC